MKGFFDKSEVASKSRPDGKIQSCAACGLYRWALNPRMQPYGKFKKGILILGEGPGETEDWRGKQWQGKVGRLLKKVLRRLGIDLFEDCLNFNAINCRPTDEKGSNRAPTDREIACCRRKVLQVIEQYQPRLIIALGGAAVKSLLGHRWKKNLGGISKWQGWTIPDRDFGAWVCPTFHPSYIDRYGDSEEAQVIWEQDLDRALSKLNEDPTAYRENDRAQVEIIKDEREVESLFGSLALGTHTNLACIDYETTGKKPQAKGHRIVCAGVATGPRHAYAFMMPKKKYQLVKFGRFLASSSVGKIAHNIKFEENWSQVRLRFGVQPWIWDSMLATHILDNRPDICSLSFQAYVNLGVIDYDSHIKPYLESQDPQNGNSFNKIYDLMDRYGEDELLTYCGLDNLYEYRIALYQMEQLNYNPLIEWGGDRIM